MYTIKPEKLKNVILYLGEALGGKIEGKKRLYKLLYFVDFDYFEKYEEVLTGETYIKLEMGPVPSTADQLINEMAKQKLVTIKEKPNALGYSPTTVYHFKQKPNPSAFTKKEKEILDLVVKKYGNLHGRQLERLTHSEAPFISTTFGGIIQYETAFYRGTFEAAEGR